MTNTQRTIKLNLTTAELDHYEDAADALEMSLGAYILGILRGEIKALPAAEVEAAHKAEQFAKESKAIQEAIKKFEQDEGGPLKWRSQPVKRHCNVD